MAEPLIPDEVRALYERLLSEGPRIIDADDPTWRDPTTQTLLECGLAIRIERVPPVLVATVPEAAFEQASTHWARRIEVQKKRRMAVEAVAVSLQRSAVRSVAAAKSNHACVVIAGSFQVAALHRTLLHSAETLVRAFNTGPYNQPRLLPDGAPHPVASAYVDHSHEFEEHGGRIRAVCDEEFVDAFSDELRRAHEEGEQTRVVQKKLPMKLLIVDDFASLVPLGPYGSPCLLTHDAGLVALFTQFFEFMWSKATPWAPPGPSVKETENAQRRRILEALAAGLKDEAIARQLGVSVRTVRRHITGLMKELGATTRFAAGVAAVRRGWLTPAA